MIILISLSLCCCLNEILPQLALFICCFWVITENSIFQGQKKKKKRSIYTAKNTLVLSQVSILPASKRKERTEQISFQALAFRILFDDFQSMHQKYLQPLSCKKGSGLAFQWHRTHSGNCTSWFSGAFLRVTSHFQILAHETRCGEAPRNGCVHVAVGDQGGTCTLSIPGGRISEVRGVWEQCPEAQEKERKKKKPKPCFSQSPQVIKNLAPWNWAKQFSGLHCFLKLEKVFSGKYPFTTAMGETGSSQGLASNLL